MFLRYWILANVQASYRNYFSIFSRNRNSNPTFLAAVGLVTARVPFSGFPYPSTQALPVQYGALRPPAYAAYTLGYVNVRFFSYAR